MSEIITAVKDLAEQDQSIPNSSITRWCDDAINRINQTLQCNIALTGGNTTTLVPDFDVRFHESLVIFCVARYRESDGDYNAATYFLNTFNDSLRVMQRDMIIKPSQRVDYNVQQIVVTNATTTTYSLTMPTGSYYDIITVYQNDILLDNDLSTKYYINSSNKTITLYTTLALNDKITVVYENNSDLNNPPYEWWNF